MFSKTYAAIFSTFAMLTGLSALAKGGVPVAALTVHCSGTGIVSATANPSFKPALIHHPATRVPDLPATIGFDAVVDVQSLSAGCQVLADKYGIDLSGASLNMHAGASEALSDPPLFSLMLAQLAATDAVGQPVTFTLTQSFPYQIGNQLPLYPVLHSEGLNLSAPLVIETEPAELSLELEKGYKVDVQAVYGITPADQLSDNDKLSAALVVESALTGKIAAGDSELGYIFETLLLDDLKPTAKSALPAYKDGLVDFLDQIAALPYQSSFFSFPVGGAGGAAIANALAQLSNVPGVLADGEGPTLLVKYPELALLGLGTCFAAGPDALTDALQTALATPSLTMIQKAGFTDVTDEIAHGYLNITACYPEAHEPAVKALSIALAKKLHASI